MAMTVTVMRKAMMLIFVKGKLRLYKLCMVISTGDNMFFFSKTKMSAVTTCFFQSDRIKIDD